jgi:hypothetical protein
MLAVMNFNSAMWILRGVSFVQIVSRILFCHFEAEPRNLSERSLTSFEMTIY